MGRGGGDFNGSSSAVAGDHYPCRGAPSPSVGGGYHQALGNYIQQVLNGIISAAAYPAGGAGRITVESGS